MVRNRVVGSAPLLAEDKDSWVNAREPMRFTKLVLENWRNFTHVDITLGTRAFFVGANASGKSNLLDVFRFLKELAEPGGGLRRALDVNRRGLRAVRSLHARKNHVTIEIGAEINAVRWRYALTLEPRGRTAAGTVQSERVERDDKVLFDRPDDDDDLDPERLEQTYLEQKGQNVEFRELVTFLASVQYTHVVPQLVRDPGGAQDRERFGEALGADFVEQIARCKPRERDRRLGQIGEALRSVLPQFDELVFEKDEVGRPHLKTKYKHWRKPGAWQREDQFSDGTLRLLGVLWYLSGNRAPLLLEEPELSLHPSAVRQLPRILAGVGASTERQVLLSTHSPDLLGDTGIAPDEVFLLLPTHAATEVQAGNLNPRLVDVAAADQPLGPTVEAITRPKDILKLASWPRRARQRGSRGTRRRTLDASLHSDSRSAPSRPGHSRMRSRWSQRFM
jgi:predicted ATPase